MDLTYPLMKNRSFKSWFIFTILLVSTTCQLITIESIFSESSSNDLPPSTSSLKSHVIPKLTSGVVLSDKLTVNTTDHLRENADSYVEYSEILNVLENPNFTLIDYRITASAEPNITNITPEAMELNATSIVYILNFTLGSNAYGENIVENLTFQYPNGTTDLIDWSNGWTHLRENGSFIDSYSIKFTLNESFLSNIEVEIYQIHLFTNDLTVISSDFIFLPMNDLKVVIIDSPSEFNNLYGEDVAVNLRIRVTETTHLGGENQPLTSLPNINNTNGTRINPLVSINSSTISGNLSFSDFVDVSQSGSGIYEIEYILSPSIAQLFSEGIHELIVQVTSAEGISDYNSRPITAKGTIYLVDLENIRVESNSVLDYDSLIAANPEGVVFRLNVNDTIEISFTVYEKDGGVSEIDHTIFYQDPNDPENVTARLSYKTDITGTGSITLTSEKISLKNGYPLFFYVRGGNQFQNISKITIYWDLLIYNYTFIDSNGDSGSSSDLNSKALGVDINKWWKCTLGIYYASDGASVLGGKVSYKFGNLDSTILEDGVNNTLDGFFPINYTHDTAEEVIFACTIISRSDFDPQGTEFVNKTSGQSEFNLSITWTYLIINMIPDEQDRRLSIREQTDISLNVTWAHNSSFISPFGDLSIIVYDHATTLRTSVLVDSGVGTYIAYAKYFTGIYNYSIIEVLDGTFGVFEFRGNISVEIICEYIEFTYSNTYNASLAPEVQEWGVSNFIAPYGYTTTLYIYARHSYDNSTFNGSAELFVYDLVNFTPSIFINGISTWTGDLSYLNKPVRFGILLITDEYDYGVKRVDPNPEIFNVAISWDYIVVSLSSNSWYSHGTWANINISFQYKINGTVPTNLQLLRFSLGFSHNETVITNVSWNHFRDFSKSPTSRTYRIIDLFDGNTFLSKFSVEFLWNDISMDPEDGNLTIYWIDTDYPFIVELKTYDLGNGSIFIILDCIDENENWIGIGIDRVELYDLREGIDALFPVNPLYQKLSSGIHRYIFKYDFNQSISNEFFTFDFGETLKFSLSVLENELTFTLPAELRSSYPRIGEPKRIEVLTYPVVVNYDPYSPSFRKENNAEIFIEFPDLEKLYETNSILSDGAVIISAKIKDDIWSGIDQDNLTVYITNLDDNSTTPYKMTTQTPTTSLRDEIIVNWEGILSVGGTYQITVEIFDRAGNRNSRTLEIFADDHVAPRVEGIEIHSNQNHELDVTVNVTESGYGVETVQVRIFRGSEETKREIIRVNLTIQVGEGSQSLITNSLEVYHTKFTLPFTLEDVFLPSDFTLEVMTSDSNGNQKIYSTGELDNLNFDFTGRMDPILFHPYILFAGLVVLVFGVIVAIRITSRVEGYDIKRIFLESEKIPREVILTQMDEYALGVTVNFFDQVQGPVPVIWEPALLEDQEQVMLDLADKSFSTLEFIGLEESERSGTFDFSTGSYECTALGYSFAIDNPKARGGKENLTVVLLLRKEWGDNLLIFQDEITEKLREIREMIETQKEPSTVEKKARELREFVSRLMLSFNKIYADINYEDGIQEES